MTNSSEIKFGDIVMPHYQGVYGSTHRLTLDWCVRGVLPDGRRFALIVREGFTFDGASIPRALWRICGHPLEVPRVAAALAHDIGHTPFGHAGEYAMQKCYDPDFTHYKQSLRVVEKLENNGRGLNLTWEVRDGIVNHTGSCMASTLEGVIVKFADRIAYINHDIDDACRAGILSVSDIPQELRDVLGESHSQRINTMVTSIIRESTGKPLIAMESEVQEATNRLRTFLFEHVYRNPVAKSEESKAQEMLVRMFDHFVKHPDTMPELYRRNIESESVERCVCDFLSGMTDRYAIEVYSDLYIPKVWKGAST